jgi:chromate transporter
VWFSLHVLFGKLETKIVGPMRLLVPDPATVDWVSLALCALAVVLVFGFRLGIAATLAVCAVAALLWLGVAPA